MLFDVRTQQNFLDNGAIFPTYADPNRTQKCGKVANPSLLRRYISP